MYYYSPYRQHLQPMIRLIRPPPRRPTSATRRRPTVELSSAALHFHSEPGDRRFTPGPVDPPRVAPWKHVALTDEDYE